MKSNHFFSNYFASYTDIIFFITGIVMLVTEGWKQMTLTYVLGGGCYNWWYFPFQLCSIPMYLLPVYPLIRKRSARLALLSFLMCYSLLGGVAVFADTSGLHYDWLPLTVHSYLWHFALILIGCLAGAEYRRVLICQSSDPSGAVPVTVRKSVRRSFAGATLLYLFCCLCAEALNLSLDSLGRINMFYINPDYPMQQVIFRDIARIIGNIPGILLYITATIFGAALIMSIWTSRRLPK